MPSTLVLPRCALILARISDARVRAEDGTWTIDKHGVDRQVRRLLDRAANLGWQVGPASTHHIIENDVSAYRRVLCTLPDTEPWYGKRERRPKRPDYWRALRMLWTGAADGMIALDLDRACRDPRDLEDLLDVMDHRPVPVESVTGTLRVATSSDRAVARILVSVASKSSADTARRVADSRQDAARTGKRVGGWRRFGWERGNEELRQDEADEIEQWAAQVLAGVPLRQIALDLRQRDVSTTHKAEAQWSTAAIRGILLHPAIMGKLVYRPDPPAGVPRTGKSRLYTPDEIVADAPWKPIISESDYWRIRSILTDESRRSGPGNVPKWLLSCLAVCGRCGDVMLRAAGVGRFGPKQDRPAIPCYRCRTCSGLRRPVEFADRVVSEVITRYLAQEDAGDLLPAPAPGINRAALEQERSALRARRLVQLGMHAQGTIDEGELKTTLEAFRAREAAISAELDSAGERSPLAGIAGRPDASEIWEGLTLGLKREIIRTCCDAPPVVFLHGKPPDVFDPGLITVNLKDTC